MPRTASAACRRTFRSLCVAALSRPAMSPFAARSFGDLLNRPMWRSVARSFASPLPVVETGGVYAAEGGAMADLGLQVLGLTLTRFVLKSIRGPASLVRLAGNRPGVSHRAKVPELVGVDHRADRLDPPVEDVQRH